MLQLERYVQLRELATRKALAVSPQSTFLLDVHSAFLRTFKCFCKLGAIL